MSFQPNKDSTLEQWVEWLSNLYSKEIDLGLDRIRQVGSDMQLLQPAPKVITVAGTNGKGSSVSMLVAILKQAGYRVGSYTSPHILQFNERIQINQQPVADKLIIDAFHSIEQSRKAIKLTYFEFATLAALAIFKAAEVDVAVLEVGLGGRLDAVNVVDADAALITAIDIDHIDWLGDDREQIAVEKAGVMRPGRLAVCSDANPPGSLAAYAQAQQVDLWQLGEDFHYRSQTVHVKQADQSIPPTKLAKSGQWVWQSALFNPEPFSHKKACVQSFKLPSLKGSFQIQNAAGVVTLLTQLWARKQLFSDLNWQQVVKVVNQGLQACVHPGRLQTLRINQQNWLIDVAHNPQSAQVLVEFLQQNATPKNRLVAIFSVLNDKDSLPMVKMLAPYIKHWLIADLQNPRAMSLEALEGLLGEAGVQNTDKVVVMPQSSIGDCVEAALAVESDVLVFGSFFTVSQAFSKLIVQGFEQALTACQYEGIRDSISGIAPESHCDQRSHLSSNPELA